MTDPDVRYLDAFPEWLLGLGVDARALADVVEREDLPDAVRRQCAVALNYLFKSVDLIPDGIEDLGYIDDAFVCRVAAVGALESSPKARGLIEDDTLARLAADAQLVREFLGDDYGRLVVYIRALESVSVRGRNVDDLFRDEEARAGLVSEARAWAAAYRPPTFARDTKNLVKLRAFLNAKLPV
ncbi:MAG: DUF1232 domain-containing protein [Polyangiaceae bacterium]|nr:DUF1232 domain-containing protein [Polyangiaceae bacterium]